MLNFLLVLRRNHATSLHGRFQSALRIKIDFADKGEYLDHHWNFCHYAKTYNDREMMKTVRWLSCFCTIHECDEQNAAPRFAWLQSSSAKALVVTLRASQRRSVL